MLWFGGLFARLPSVDLRTEDNTAAVAEFTAVAFILGPERRVQSKRDIILLPDQGQGEC